MHGQQQVWTQLEAFSRQIHGSLHPREVCYQVANEGRRLVQCDRVSVAIRQGHSTRVEAISGADVIEKRSALVQHMRELFDQVLVWGERLVYSGAKDESLPPKVLHALDRYLEESASKLLIIAPMKDEREAERKRPARSALMVESFEPNVTPEQMAGRMDIVIKHAASAVYNAVELRRLPFRWLLQPLANLKDSLRGNRGAIAAAILGAVLLLGLAMAVIPYPLRMEAKGSLMPRDRQTVYSRVDGEIIDVAVKNGQRVHKDQELLKIKNLDLLQKIHEAQNEKDSALGEINIYQEELNKATDEQRRLEYRLQLSKAQTKLEIAEIKLRLLREESPNPRASPVRAPQSGVVVTFDPNERLGNRIVKPGDPLVQIADADGEWEFELLIPEGRVGHIREALAESDDGRLAVDILISSYPDARSFRGWLTRESLGGMVEMHENEPMLRARVQIEPDPKEGGITRDMLDRMPVGADVKAKIRCGNRAVGYVWFHELWEFFYEKVLF
jgi:biotin carboxyl carrier protein